MNTNTLIWQRVNVVDVETERATVNRLMAAAIVNKNFCALLLRNPRQAIETGFSDEQFNLAPQTQEILESIHAATIKDFAQQFLDKMRNTHLAM